MNDYLKSLSNSIVKGYFVILQNLFIKKMCLMCLDTYIKNILCVKFMGERLYLGCFRGHGHRPEVLVRWTTVTMREGFSDGLCCYRSGAASVSGSFLETRQCVHAPNTKSPLVSQYTPCDSAVFCIQKTARLLCDTVAKYKQIHIQTGGWRASKFQDTSSESTQMKGKTATVYRGGELRAFQIVRKPL